MYASQYGKMDTARALIASGADTMAMDNFGRTAFDLSKEFQHTDITNLLVRNMH
jgi:ankyrin repeat protein